MLAPHLTGLLKQELGLPHWDDARRAPAPRRHVLEKPDERYNDGGAFKIVRRDERGVMVTMIMPTTISATARRK
jgi:hypothetical protein